MAQPAFAIGLFCGVGGTMIVGAAISILGFPVMVRMIADRLEVYYRAPTPEYPPLLEPEPAPEPISEPEPLPPETSAHRDNERLSVNEPQSASSPIEIPERPLFLQLPENRFVIPGNSSSEQSRHGSKTIFSGPLQSGQTSDTSIDDTRTITNTGAESGKVEDVEDLPDMGVATLAENLRGISELSTSIRTQAKVPFRSFAPPRTPSDHINGGESEDERPAGPNDSEQSSIGSTRSRSSNNRSLSLDSASSEEERRQNIQKRRENVAAEDGERDWWTSIDQRTEEPISVAAISELCSTILDEVAGPANSVPIISALPSS